MINLAHCILGKYYIVFGARIINQNERTLEPLLVLLGHIPEKLSEIMLENHPKNLVNQAKHYLESIFAIRLMQ